MLGVAVTPSRWDDAHVVAWSLFFFSSRRRHTRWPRDWSSDVCSSDLNDAPAAAVVATGTKVRPATCIDPPESRDIVKRPASIEIEAMFAPAGPISGASILIDAKVAKSSLSALKWT